MSKREEIIELADNLIRQKGYNAFSFYEISDVIGIKTASIHYHFPSKSDLGTAVIDYCMCNLSELIESVKDKPADIKLDKFFTIYSKIQKDSKVCLVGSLATDFDTLDHNVQNKLKELSGLILAWVSEFLAEGRKQEIFQFEGLARTKALVIISNMLASVQLTRLTNKADFKKIKESIRKDLIKQSK